MTRRFPALLPIVALALACLPAAVSSALADDDLPTIRSNTERVTVRDSSSDRETNWNLAPELAPDEYLADVVHGGPTQITFVTDVDSIRFDVRVGDTYDFIIQWGSQACHTRVIGRAFAPAAHYSEAFQAEHRGRILVEIPEVYELVNVAIAMTSLGRKDDNFVYHLSDYHARVLEWFGPHAAHPFVAKLDSLVTEDIGHYFRLKMNGRAFLFDDADRIVQSPVYDRTGFHNDRTNALRPYLENMQSFADQSRFREFYRANAATYEGQMAFYRDAAGLPETKRWLDERFPGSSDYDLYRIVFSPLVSHNQSSTWFESDGFRELMPHVNFPYPEDVNRSGHLSETAFAIYAGNIVFTEINHGYLHRPGEEHSNRIAAATSQRDHWVDPSQDESYYRGIGTFNEYMNWGLVCLRIMDYVPQAEGGALIERVEKSMVRRHFPRFEAFNTRLMELYAARPEGGTITDLYPEIIAWFEGENAIAGGTD